MPNQATVKLLIHEIGERLQSVNRYRAFIEARLLIATVLGCDPDHLLMEDEQLVSESDQDKIDLLVQRRLNYEPVAYLMGQKEFYGLKFFVNPSVLIPRPETESLVGGVLSWIKSKKLTSGRILDLGTGSGCIAVALAKELGKTFEIVALDRSPEALQVAKRNADTYNLDNVKFIEGDIKAVPDMKESFDILVSNPPYIPTSEIPKLQEDIRNFEPKQALDGGARGLDFFGSIFSLWKPKVSTPGLIAIETMGPAQQSELKSTLKIEGQRSMWFDGPHLFCEY